MKIKIASIFFMFIYFQNSILLHSKCNDECVESGDALQEWLGVCDIAFTDTCQKSCFNYGTYIFQKKFCPQLNIYLSNQGKCNCTGKQSFIFGASPKGSKTKIYDATQHALEAWGWKTSVYDELGNEVEHTFIELDKTDEKVEKNFDYNLRFCSFYEVKFKQEDFKEYKFVFLRNNGDKCTIYL